MNLIAAASQPRMNTKFAKEERGQEGHMLNIKRLVQQRTTQANGFENTIRKDTINGVITIFATKPRKVKLLQNQGN